MDSFRARLAQHGLGKYTALFAEHGIDLDVVGDLTDADLEKLGVSLGDRRRILKAAGTIAGTLSSLALAKGDKPSGVSSP
jgi:hypothetical protein